MRSHGFLLALLLIGGGPAVAQAPPTPPPAQPQPAPALDGHLLRWEQVMQKVDTLQAQLSRVEKDTTFNRTQKFLGFAQYKKQVVNGPNGPTVLNMATLEMRPEAKPNDIAEKIICTGTHLYQFVPAQSEIKRFELPKPQKGQVAQDNVMAFMFGMKAIDAKQRYDMKLAKEDSYYIYLDIQPRFPADKGDFEVARIVLNRETFLPRQLWFKNGSNEVTWDIPAVKANADVKASDFEAPKPPPGWKLTVVAPQDGQPKVIRSGGQ